MVQLTIPTDFEAWKALLKRRMTSRQRFKLPVDTLTAEVMLHAAVAAVVEARGGVWTKTQDQEAAVRGIAQSLTTGKKRGIMLCGLYGNGKSTLLRALQQLLNALADLGAIGEDQGLMIIDARQFTEQAKDDKSGLLQRLAYRDLLAIEDLGNEPAEIKTYGNITAPIITLLERRYDLQTFTVITTNLTADQVRPRYGARLADRFNEMLDVVIFRGASFRK